MRKILFSCLVIFLFSACQSSVKSVFQQVQEVSDDWFYLKGQDFKKPEISTSFNRGITDISEIHNGNLVFAMKPENREIVLYEYSDSTQLLKPFPNAYWNFSSKNSEDFISTPVGLDLDSNGVLWILDSGEHHGSAPKILGWDTFKNKLYKVVKIDESVLKETSRLSDLVAVQDKALIIADSDSGKNGEGSLSAFIIWDQKTQTFTRVLERHNSTRFKKNNIPSAKKHYTQNTPPQSIGVSALALDVRQEWLYYAPFSDTFVYRIQTAFLLDRSFTYPQMASKVERYVRKPISAGLALDQNNFLYVSDYWRSSVWVIDPNSKKSSVFVHDSGIKWASRLHWSTTAQRLYLTTAFDYWCAPKKCTKEYIKLHAPHSHGLFGFLPAQLNGVD